MQTCPECLARCAANAKFCAACGARLAKGAEGHEQRKMVTVVFVDLVDSVRLGQRLDPESLRSVLLLYYRRATDVLTSHGGTVEKFIGDAIVAVFGIPELHEDDALRAVRAAAQLRHELDLLNGELERSWGVSIRVRMGVNTGEVIVGGAFGGQEIALGDATNVAARLQQVAGSGEALLGETTWRLVRSSVSVEAVNGLHLKGKTDAVTAYRLIDVAAFPSRRANTTALVGRAPELSILNDAFERVATNGRSQLVSVIGPPGVGKSRLAEAFLAGIGSQATVLRGRCLDYGDGITFWPLVEMIHQAANTHPGDRPGEALAQLAKLLGGSAESLLLSRIAGLVGLGESTASAEENAWALAGFCAALARERPLVLVFDDLHWAEDTLVELLTTLVAQLSSAPVLLCTLARPQLLDRHPQWGDDHTSIELRSLGATDTDALVDQMLGPVADAEVLKARIRSTADGNPLFVEAIVEMLVDDGILVQAHGRWELTVDVDSVAVPPTVEAVVSARVDQLPFHERVVAERASVAGQVFYRHAVSSMSPSAERPNLAERLLALTRKNIVGAHQPTALDDDTLQFRHLLVRDAAYARLPKRERATLHERFASWLELAAADRLTEYEEIVGYHLERAHRLRRELAPLDETGRQLGRRASLRLSSSGRRAYQREDGLAAIKLLSRALDLAPDGAPDRLELLLDLARALDQNGEYDRAVELLDECHAMAQEVSDELLLARSRIGRLFLQLRLQPEGWSQQAPGVVAETMEVFRRFGYDSGIAECFGALMFLAFDRSNVAEAAAANAQRLHYARLAGDRRMECRSLFVQVLCAFFGPTPAAEAIRLSRRTLVRLEGNPQMQASVQEIQAALLAMQGDAEAAATVMSEVDAFLSSEPDDYASAFGGSEFRWFTYLWCGQPREAERVLLKGFESLKHAGDRAFYPTFAAHLARLVVARRGTDAEIEALLRAAEEGASDDLVTQIPLRIARSQFLASRGQGDLALRLGREAIALSDQGDALIAQADARTSLAEVLTVLGRPAQARLLLADALARYERKGNLVQARIVKHQLKQFAAGR